MYLIYCKDVIWLVICTCNQPHFIQELTCIYFSYALENGINNCLFISSFYLIFFLGGGGVNHSKHNPKTMQTMQITVHVFYFHKCIKNDKWKKWNISQCSSLQKLTILKMRIFIVFFQLSSLHSLPFFLSHCHSITSPFCNFFYAFSNMHV